METKKAQNSLILLPSEQLVPTSHGETVLESLLTADIDIDHSCGGMGSCGTCHIFVENLSLAEAPRNEVEEQMAKDRLFGDHERLACQVLAVNGLRINVR